MDAEVGHYCGLFGIFGHEEAAEMTWQGLQALQHRGQESAGIATANDESLVCEKGIGLVTLALSPEQVTKIQNPHAIGHVRYSTSGGPDPRNAQPLLLHYRGGQVAVAHNGDLTNKAPLRRECEEAGGIFHTSSDTETIVNLLAQAEGETFIDSLHATLKRLEGAFSLLFLRPGEIHAVRDPNGYRPLSLGRLGDSYLLASETCAFSLFGAETVRDLEPGEHVIIDKDGVRSIRWAEKRRQAQCIFENVYFARPDSHVFGINVHQARVALGRRLAEEYPVEADIVVSVPESGNSAAQGYSEASGIPLDRGLVKNHYVGRTFIKPDQKARQASVRLKLAPIPEVVRGKRIVLVDDSVIRGTTSLGRIQSLRDAGAKEIHFRISCPPTSWPCFYGIDFPTRKELIAANKTPDEIARFLGVDSLGYLSLEGLMAAVNGSKETFCAACFDGDYPSPIPEGALEV